MPERTCLGCRAKKEKALLVRLVSKRGVLDADMAWRAGGRGAYICRDRGCLSQAYKKKDIFARALKAKVELPGEEGLWMRIAAG